MSRRSRVEHAAGSHPLSTLLVEVSEVLLKSELPSFYRAIEGNEPQTIGESLMDVGPNGQPLLDPSFHIVQEKFDAILNVESAALARAIAQDGSQTSLDFLARAICYRLCQITNYAIKEEVRLQGKSQQATKSLMAARGLIEEAYSVFVNTKGIPKNRTQFLRFLCELKDGAGDLKFRKLPNEVRMREILKYTVLLYRKDLELERKQYLSEQEVGKSEGF